MSVVSQNIRFWSYACHLQKDKVHVVYFTSYPLTHSSHPALGSASRKGFSLSMICSQQFITAMPYRSVEEEAAVGLELGTLSVLVSEMWILSMGTLRQWAHTCKCIQSCIGHRNNTRNYGRVTSARLQW